jgi:hypothetical protein
MNDQPITSTGAKPPERLFTFASAGWVLLLAGFFTLVAAALVLYPVYETGFQRSVGDGHNPKTYGFDLSNLTIDRALLTGSGTAKDGIHALPAALVETATPAEVELIHKNEHLNFLTSTDLVIGLTINDESRAYPVRVLNRHEVINDTLAGFPLAVTWSPLCGSAVVLDRRIDGPSTLPVEFGVSGLLVNSDLVFFDRRPGGKGESLWPQLALKAVSGPLVGRQMPLVPYALTTWKAWTDAHPATRVVLGLRTLKREYTFEPYNTYLSNDELKFPVYPVWAEPGVPRKTPIVVTGTQSGRWVARFAGTGGTSLAADSVAATASAPAETRPSAYTLNAFVFAWYAQHKDDTDYSALKR